jgi:hypothetical protein
MSLQSKKSTEISVRLFVLLKWLYIFASYKAAMLKNRILNIVNNTIVIMVVVVIIIPVLHGGIS